jgi:hypothetical protein
MLFRSFHWIDLLVIPLSFGFACAFYQNAKGINISFRNLERLGASSDMDGGDGWQAFLEDRRIPFPKE